MEAIGTEVGQKMRSAIKAKLMELGCYVDDELPDYVMVMVANKRTRAQMEDDLQLFLTSNTEAFVGWLHQVLQKLQEVTINKKLLSSSDKKAKNKSADVKKEKRDKEKKKDKHKDKDKSKHKKDKHKKDNEESIRPNIPPLYMNLAKESSPSITDVFAGQILKSHGIKLASLDKDLAANVIADGDPSLKRKLKRTKFPIIDPNSVSQVTDKDASTSRNATVDHFDVPSLTEIQRERDKLAALPRDEQIKEYNEINEKIQTLKKKLAEQLDSGSEDEEFINLRTEAEELIGVDINDSDPMPEPTPAPRVSSPRPETPNNDILEPPSSPECSRNKTPPPRKSPERRFDSEEVLGPVRRVRTPIRAPSPDKPPELPMIELNLPKRPLRDRLGSRLSNVNKVNSFRSNEEKSKEESSYERSRSNNISRPHGDKVTVRSRVNRDTEKSRKEGDKEEESTCRRRLGSRVVPLPPAPKEDDKLSNLSVASVVRAPPRPQGHAGAPASQLLLRAVADAHKSILTMPPKTNETTRKKAVVMPIRRNADPVKIIIQVPSDNIPMSISRDNSRDLSGDEIDIDTESLGELESDSDNKKSPSPRDMEYIPEPLSRSISQVDYVPTHIDDNEIEMPVISRVLHLKNNKPAVKKDPQFVVTLEGVSPNMFLEKKLCKEIEEEKLTKALNRQRDSEDRECSSSTLDGELRGNRSQAKHNETQRARTKSHSPKPNQDIDKSSSILSKDRVDKITKTSENSKPAFDNDVTKNLKKEPDVEVKRQKIITKITFNNDCSSTKEVSSPTKADSSSGGEDKGTKRKSDAESEKPVKQKRCVSPIVFDKVEESNTSSKYSVLPPLADKKVKKASFSSTRCKFYPDCALGPACEFYHPPTSASPTAACRAFPNCPFADKCAYGHPPCKFDVLCTRTGCPYSHNTTHKGNKLVLQNSPAIASRVVPVQNYKTISSNPLPAICKFYPNCTNIGCHFFHPKPCRYGKACLNKIECNFYHHEILPTMKFYS